MGSSGIAHIPEPPVKALYIAEDTLPVRPVIPDHVLHLQQGGDTGKHLSCLKAQAEVIFPVPVFSPERVPVKTIWVEGMDE
jgi:hypothetical protein